MSSIGFILFLVGLRIVESNSQSSCGVDEHTRNGLRSLGKVRAENRGRLESLVQNPFPIRLRILYDDAFEAELVDQQERDKAIRNLILTTQMIFEQPELYGTVKIYLVVTEISKLRQEFPLSMNSHTILDKTDELQGPSALEDKYDLTVILFWRNIFTGLHGPKLGWHLRGLANLSAFCNRVFRHPSAVLIRMVGLNMATTLAHELAHTLSVLHDGSGDIWDVERNCSNGEYLMRTHEGVTLSKWSPCSVKKISQYITRDLIYDCVFSSERINTKPYSELFDFGTPMRPGPGRDPEPGQQLDADAQCRLSLDRTATRGKLEFGDICQKLTCALGDEETKVEAALPGTSCRRAGREARCRSWACPSS